MDYLGSLCVNQVDEKGAALKRPDALDAAFRLGHMLASTDVALPRRPVKIEVF